MTEIDLSRLNSASFEKLVRALAFAEMGPAGVTFASGADGARDFTYEGKIPGFEGRAWDGYLIVQAKFRAKLQGSQEDVDWLNEQLNAELAKFSDKRRDLRRPNYYLLATNVSLSGVQTTTKAGRKKTGSFSKIEKCIESWKKSFGLRDFHIWGADQILDLLGKHPGIRQTYAAWVTSGDVLSEVLRSLSTKEKNFNEIIRRAVIRRLAADQFVPLNESGSVGHKKILTSKVFIDLPVLSSSRSHENSGFVAGIVDISKSILGGEHTQEEDSEANNLPSNRGIVLLGGPGQGKSTTGLFAIQLFRAALVKDMPETKTDPTICDLVPDILERAEKQQLSIQLPRRYPVHVSLPSYADRISDSKKSRNEVPSLLSHIAHEIGRAADAVVDREDIRGWLGHHPWLVVLDGLDEVPSSGERPAVIEQVNVFRSEIAQCRGDVLVIVTSRPQGYNKDLSEKFWEHWYLSDIDTDLAISYAEALSLAQHPLDPDRRTKIMSGLKRAMQQQATARLMVSPLQVTIMHLIIDGGGSAPVGRWALFNEYFQVLKKREKAKGGETQEVLERNWDHLDPVHHRAGLVLQTESETSGGATAQLTLARLKMLIVGYLKSCGYQTPDREVRAEELARLSLTRLVLLSMRQQGQTEDEGLISFDVRSLQEFMAAAELTTESDSPPADFLSGKQPKIEDRLTRIAGIAHWRHVFLIAASRCFSETALHHLRSIIVGIPRTLDTHYPDRISRTGAQLALELLLDGLGSNHPISRCKLVENALDLLDLGPENFSYGLSSIWSTETAGIFEDVLKRRLNEGVTPGALSAWKLLFQLCKKNPEIFLQFAEKNWPVEHGTVLKIIQASDLDIPDQFLARARSAFKSSPPSELLESVSRSIKGRRELPSSISFLQLLRVRQPEHSDGLALLDRESPLRVLVKNVEELEIQKFEEDVQDWHKNWQVFLAAAKFSRAPSPSSLAAFLSIMEDQELRQEMIKLSSLLPWPLQYFILEAKSGTDVDISSFSPRAESGEFGDRLDWLSAEERWKQSSISDVDILASENPISNKIGRKGSPPIDHMIFVGATPTTSEIVIKLDELGDNLTKKGMIRALSRGALFCLAVSEEKLKIGTNTLISLAKKSWHAADIGCLLHITDDAWVDDQEVEHLAEFASKSRHHWRQKNKWNVLPIIEAYCAAPSRRSLLFAIAVGLVTEPEKVVVTISKLPESALQYTDNDDWRVKAAVSVFRILKLEDLSSEVISGLLPSECSSSYLLAEGICSDGILPRATREALLTAILQCLADRNREDKLRLRVILKKVLDERKSGFADRSLWIEKLQLPADAFEVLSP